MDFDPKYTEIEYSHRSGGFILRDTRTGKIKKVQGVTSHIHSVFNKNKKEPDIATTTFAEAAMKHGTDVHAQFSAWVNNPSTFRKMGTEGQVAASMLVAQFPPSQGWSYSTDVPVTDYKKYASEIDLLVTNEKTGEVHIVDLKTGGWHGGEYNAQLSFYKRMYEMGHPDQKVAGIWGLRTQDNNRGFVKAHEFTKQDLDGIFYKGVRPKRVVNMNRGQAARQTNVLDHFEPAKRQSGSGVSRPVTFFDVETGPRNEILQIGAIKGVFNKEGKFQVIDRFARHFTGDPSTYSTQEWALLQETHGITPETARLRGKKWGRWGEKHFNAFKEFIGDSALAGHNIEQFDIPVVFGDQMPSNDIIDTLHIAKNIRGSGVNKLGQLFALTTGKSMAQAGFHAHDALGDVMANASMFEGWLGRDKSPFQEYSRMVLDNPGMSTIFKNTYTGAAVRMKDDELTPEDLLSMNIGTGMGFEDLSDMLDEERSTRLDRNPPPGFSGGGPSANFSALDRAETNALISSLVHNVGSMNEFTHSLSTSVHNHSAQIRNNMLRSMVDYTDEDARSILQRMYGNDTAVDRDMQTIATLRRAKYRGRARIIMEKAAAHGLNLADMPDFHDLTLVADGATHTFTTNEAGVGVNTPLDSRAITKEADVALNKLIGRKGVVDKAHRLARYADYYGMHARAASLRMVDDEEKWFSERMGFTEEHRAMEAKKHFEDKRGDTVMRMLVDGHQPMAAQAAALAENEEQLYRARKKGQEELKAYTAKIDTFHKALEGVIAAPGQLSQGMTGVLSSGRQWSHGLIGASRGFMAPELSQPFSHLADAVWDSVGASSARFRAGTTNASNILGGALTGAGAGIGFGPIGAIIGASVGAGSQVIPALFNAGQGNMEAQLGDLSGRLNLWSAVVGFIEAPFKMLARVTKDLTRSFVGLSAGIGGIMIGGLNKMSTANEHYASLTGISHRQYQRTFAADAWLGLKEGSFAASAEDAISTMRTFLTSGEGQHKWANLALSGSLSSYLNMGSYDGYIAMLNEMAQQGFDDPSRQRDIMSNAIAAFGKGTTTDTLQAMWTHGVRDAGQFGRNAANRMHVVDLNNAWQYRINENRTEWQYGMHGFDNAWMKIASRAWESFGRDIMNVVLDVMNAFGDGGLAGGLRELKAKALELWEAFNSETGIGGSGINMDGLLDMGKNILGHILKGLGDAVAWATPYAVSAMQKLMRGLLDIIGTTLGQIEPYIATMATYRINPDILKVFGNIFTALGGGGMEALKSAGEAILGMANLKGQDFIEGSWSAIPKGSGRAADNAELALSQYFGDYNNTIADYASTLRKNKKGEGDRNGAYYDGYSWEGLRAHINKAGASSQVFTLYNGMKFSEDMIVAMQQEKAHPNTTPARRAQLTEQLNALKSAVDATFSVAMHGDNEWVMSGTYAKLGLAHNKGDFFLQGAWNEATEAIPGMAGEAVNLAGMATKSALHAMGDNLLTVRIEVDDKRVKVTTGAGDRIKEITTNTLGKIDDIIQLKLAARSAAAEGVH